MSSQNLHNLFQNVQQNGMSHQSVDLLIQNLNGQAALGCIGAQIDELNTDDVTLLVVILDESGSMGGVRNEVIDSFNQMTRALNDSKNSDSILMSAWKFADQPRLLFGYTPIDRVKDLTKADYDPQGSTALYDTILDGFRGIVAYGQDLRNNGLRTRAIIVVISDGEDNVSKYTASAVHTVSQDLIKQEYYTLAFVGLGHPATFQQIAKNIGFNQVLTVNNSPAEIRRALQMISGSVIRASQGVINTNGNGFFTP
ncbi:MAG: VWA domain-containing protein [Anaerolineae bacterium]|nr:VWA domain-containing protein [Anaerolineae bacterium]